MAQRHRVSVVTRSRARLPVANVARLRQRAATGIAHATATHRGRPCTNGAAVGAIERARLCFASSLRERGMREGGQRVPTPIRPSALTEAVWVVARSNTIALTGHEHDWPAVCGAARGGGW